MRDVILMTLTNMKNVFQNLSLEILLVEEMDLIVLR